MKFVKTYEQTSWNYCYKPYFYINNKRVSEEDFEETILISKLKCMNYKSSFLTCKGNRYKATFYYD